MVNLKDNTAGLGFNAGSFGITNEVKDYLPKVTASKKTVIPNIPIESKVSSLVGKLPDVGAKTGLPIHVNTSSMQSKITSSLTKGLRPNGLLGEVKSGLTRSLNGGIPCTDFNFKLPDFGLGWNLGFGLPNFNINCDTFLGPISAGVSGLKDAFNFNTKSAFELSQMSDAAVIDYHKALETMQIDKLLHDKKSVKTMGSAIPSYLKAKPKLTEYDMLDLNNNPDVMKEAGKSNKSFSSNLLRATDTSKVKDKQAMYTSMNNIMFNANGSNTDEVKVINMNNNQSYKDLGAASLKHAQPSMTVISEPSIEAMAF